jgi:primosomal protein N' (replication factor Y)
MSGIVVDLHDRKPSVVTKNVVSVLDPAPVLDEPLMRLGKWIADYYLAPLGEVFRTMLPLSAEFRRTITYRITEQGHMALHLGGMSGSSARARRTPDEQLAEFRVLDYLANREDPVRETSLRSATRVSRAVLGGMVRKKWIEREDVSDARDAARIVKVAVLSAIDGAGGMPSPAGEDARHSIVDSTDKRDRATTALNDGATGVPARRAKLNANQQTLIEALAAAGGHADVDLLHSLDVPRSTLSTLVKRGLIDIVEEPAEFHVSRVKARPSPFGFEFNPAQKQALLRSQEAMSKRKFGGILLHGVTGSGKTAVYLAAMRTVLEQGRSAILLVPEIGLTPTVAADLHQVFGDEVAILHSALSNQERAEQWHRIKRGEARMVVGTRSAVFAPVSDLALIIVDEEQDSSYKQEETPRYHARDVAVMRAKMADAVVVLGSATPSLESYYNSKKNKYALIAWSGDRCLGSS